MDQWPSYGRSASAASAASAASCARCNKRMLISLLL